MKNAGSSMVAIILGAAGLAAASAWAPAHADPAATAHAVAKAKANKAPKKAKPAAPAATATPANDHCALDDLGYDSMLAKKSDAPAPAPAPKGKPAVDTIAKSKAAADKFDLGRKSRDSLRPTDDTEVKMSAKTLSSAAVGDVVEERLPDLEYCFMKIPEKDRASEEFTLHLSIAAKGTVVSCSVEGDQDAALIQACVEAQVKRWAFPQADAPTEIDYPLSLHVQHIEN